MALVVSATSKLYSGFGSPLSIPGCFLWLDAADSSTLTLSGSNVMQWNDKSGMGYHASNVGGGFPIFNDVSTGVVFSGGQQLRTSAPSGIRTETGFLVTRNRGGLGSPIGASSAGYRSLQFTGTTIYLINRDVLVIAQGENLPANQRFLVSYDSESRILYDGTQIVTGVLANYSTGAGVTWIGNDSRAFTYTGDIHEIILFSNTLTATQHQAVEGYLARKWNLTSRIPTSHPYKTTNAFMRPFQPLDISGCLVWIDGQDRASYTLSNSNVTAWNDRSGNGYNFVRMSAGPTVSTLNGRPALDIGDGRSISNATAPIPTSYSVFSVANRTSGSSYQYFMKLGVVDTMGYLFMGAVDGRYATFAGTSSVTWWDSDSNSPVVSIGSNPVLLQLVNDGTTLTPYTSGIAQNTKTGTTSPTTGLVIGSARGGGATWSGSMGEFLMFDRPLRGSERQQIEGYMAWRWGVVSDLSTSHPFKLVPPLVPVFSPLHVGRCAVWLDADDRSTITMSGSNVAQWRDKSGSGYTFNAAPPGCSLPVVGTPINGRTTVGITSTVMGIRQATVIDGLKTIFWIRREITGNRGYEFYFGADSTSDFHTGVSEYAGSGLAQNGIRDATLNIITSSNVVTGTPGGRAVSSGYAINILRMSGLTGSTRFQGLSYDRGNTGRSMMCDWGELLLYTTDLAQSQIRAIEGYLAQKWGIQSYLSSSHPYKLSPP